MAVCSDLIRHSNLARSGLQLDQIEIIWQMGMASLASNDNELVLPMRMAKQLSEENIEELKLRLSDHLDGAATMTFVNHQDQTLRIRQASGPCKETHKPPSYTSPLRATPAPRSTPPGKEVREPGKTRIPRPPNAFILYRQKYHPILKAQRPDMHNNDISVILGKQWKSEPENVKAEYKALAEKMKHKHAAENPGYQYAPRKSSGKKRRTTARKLAQRRVMEVEKMSQTVPPIEILEAANHDRSEVEDAVFDNDDDCEIITSHPPSASAVLGTDRPSNGDELRPKSPSSMSIMLPTSHRTVQQDLDTHISQIPPTRIMQFDLANGLPVTSTTAPHANNDQDFFNSLIDWEGIRADMDIIKESTSEELDELAGVELGTPCLTFSDEAQRLEFEAELERILQLFE